MDHQSDQDTKMVDQNVLEYGCAEEEISALEGAHASSHDLVH